MLVLAAYCCLTRDLRGELSVGKTGGREDRKLLTSYQRVQTVDSGNARLDEFLRIVARGGVHRRAVDVHALFGDQRGAVVDRVAQTVKYARKHVG